MIQDQRRSRRHLPNCIAPLAAVMCAIGALCTLPATAEAHGASANQVPAPPTTTAAPLRTRARHNQKEEMYFERRYGIGQLRVSSISAGASLEFRCQVLDVEKAKALNDRRVAPVVIERKTGKKLSVANTDSDGKPIQRVTPEAGQENRVVFGNPGRLVKPGNLVDLVIGTVHISGLIVE
jgi:hypothetical protein